MQGAFSKTQGELTALGEGLKEVILEKAAEVDAEADEIKAQNDRMHEVKHFVLFGERGYFF